MVNFNFSQIFGNATEYEVLTQNFNLDHYMEILQSLNFLVGKTYMNFITIQPLEVFLGQKLRSQGSRHTDVNKKITVVSCAFKGIQILSDTDIWYKLLARQTSTCILSKI
jgi:hypothetical protein